MLESHRARRSRCGALRARPRRCRPRASAARRTAAATPPTGAMIVERREVDVDGERRRPDRRGARHARPGLGPAARASSDGGGLSVTEQRFVPGAATPDEILRAPRRRAGHGRDREGRGHGSAALGRRAGARARGRHRRYAAAPGDAPRWLHPGCTPRGDRGCGQAEPGVARRGPPKPGKHQVEVTYRADGLTLERRLSRDPRRSPRRRSTSPRGRRSRTRRPRRSTNAELTLVDSNGASAGTSPQARRPGAAPVRFTVPGSVKLGSGEAVQVELFPPRTAAKVRSVVMFEAMPDSSGSFQAVPGDRLQPAQLERGHLARRGRARGRRPDEGPAARWPRAAASNAAARGST